MGLTQEHQHSAHPLHGADGVGEEDHRGQNGEELSSCGDDGAGQGTKIYNSHEDKALGKDRKARCQAGFGVSTTRSEVCNRKLGLSCHPSSPRQAASLGEAKPPHLKALT